MLRCIIAHEHSVYRLAAWVIADRELAEPLGVGKLAELEVDLSDMPERLHVQLFQLPLFGQVPFAGDVIVEQWPSVEPDGLVVSVDALLEPVRSAGLPRVVECRQKLVAVDPPGQSGIEDVAAVTVQNGLSA